MAKFEIEVPDNMSQEDLQKIIDAAMFEKAETNELSEDENTETPEEHEEPEAKPSVYQELLALSLGKQPLEFNNKFDEVMQQYIDPLLATEREKLERRLFAIQHPGQEEPVVDAENNGEVDEIVPDDNTEDAEHELEVTEAKKGSKHEKGEQKTQEVRHKEVPVKGGKDVKAEKKETKE
jgi:hypothetical protein